MGRGWRATCLGGFLLHGFVSVVIDILGLLRGEVWRFAVENS